MAYDTNNPVGSKDPRDLYDNATNFDKYSNGEDPFYPNRFGVMKLSIEGMNQQFNDAQSGRAVQFSEFLEASGYEYIGDYGAGITFTTRTQYTVRDGVLYRVAADTTLPYTTTGNWTIEQVKFVAFDTEDLLKQDLAETPGSGLVGYSPSETYPEATVGRRLRAEVYATDSPFNAVADGVTDNTAAVLAAAIAVAPTGIVRIPFNVLYNAETLLNDVTCPANVLFGDESRTEVAGGAMLTIWFEKGDSTSVRDWSPTFSSGHNMTFNLDNSGKSGSASGNKRVSVLAWTGGRMGGGAAPGLTRSISRLEMAQSSVDSNRWSYVIRKRAPWAAVAANYTRWLTGEVVAAGAYTFYQNRYYTTATGGTTGATPPTHTTGTVSDGGVDWTYVQFSYDASPFYIDDLGRIGLNTAPTTGSHFMRLRQSPDDTGPFFFQYEPVGASKTVTFRGRPTNSSSVAVTAIPDLRITEDGWEFLSSLGSVVGKFSNEGFTQSARIEPAPTAADGDTTPTVLNRAAITLSNSTPTSITTLDDGVTDQVVTLWAGNGNTTLVAGAGFNMVGTGNLVLTALSCITFKKTALSGAWLEQSRCIQ